MTEYNRAKAEIVLMGSCGACGQPAGQLIGRKDPVWFHLSPNGCPKAHSQPDPKHPAVFIPGPPNSEYKRE